MARSVAPLALVTGANRGLGLEVCRQLARAGWWVYLAARDGDRAQAAATALSRDGLAVTPETLDVTRLASVVDLAERLRSRDERLSALVNNAGIYLAGVTAQAVRESLAVNYRGAVDVTEVLRPLLAPNGRIVMVSGGGGELAGLPAALRARLEFPSLTRAGVDAIVAEYQAAADRGELRKRASRHDALWPHGAYAAYAVSKAALNAYTRLLAGELGPRGPRVNAVCPGWVRTEMGGATAPRSVAEGARGIVWAATLPPDGPSGGFFRDG